MKNAWHLSRHEYEREWRRRDDAIVQACIAGETVDEMAERFNVNRARIHQLIKKRRRMGELFPPARRPDVRRQRDRDRWIAEQVERGIPSASIADEVSLSEVRITAIAREWRRSERRRIDAERRRVFTNADPLTSDELASMPAKLVLSLAALDTPITLHPPLQQVKESFQQVKESLAVEKRDYSETIALGINEIQRVTSLDRTFIYEAIQSGDLATSKVVGEFRMAKWADVVAWIDALVAKSQAGSDVTP